MRDAAGLVGTPRSGGHAAKRAPRLSLTVHFDRTCIRVIKILARLLMLLVNGAAVSRKDFFSQSVIQLTSSCVSSLGLYADQLLHRVEVVPPNTSGIKAECH